MIKTTNTPSATAPDCALAAVPNQHWWRGQKVLVLGLGVSGLAMARWCVRAGAQVTLADTRSAPPLLAQLKSELPAVRFVGGAFNADLVRESGARAVFKSPGLSPAQAAPVIDCARSIGLWVSGELGLYAQALKQLKDERGYAPSVLAITGSNGKTTVATLTAQLVEHSGKSTALAGNIGPTLLDTLSQHLDNDSLPAVWVLELSSFQLDEESSFAPSAAVLLNISQNHLDWHPNMAAYVQAKSRIFGAGSLRILNRQDPATLQLLPTPNLKTKGQKTPAPEYVLFGDDLPKRAGDFGLESVAGMGWLVRAQALEADSEQRDPAKVELFMQRLMPTEALRLRGRHNATNALAALALASSAGCSMAPMLYGLRQYRSQPHRMQSVGVINAVEYFDDSKGTNIGATTAALCSLGNERKVVLILGGQGKGQDFAALAQPVGRYARAVLLIGVDAARIKAALVNSGVPLLDGTTLADAVHQASRLAQAGDAVLLSPACASFDMFDNYQQRGQVFTQAVVDLAHEAGLMLEANP